MRLVDAKLALDSYKAVAIQQAGLTKAAAGRIAQLLPGWQADVIQASRKLPYIANGHLLALVQAAKEFAKVQKNPRSSAPTLTAVKVKEAA